MTVENGSEEGVVVRGGIGPEQPCPYRPGLLWRNEIILPEGDLGAEVHELLFDLGFRRSGQAFFRPACADCRSCRSLRIATPAFRRSKSQRRVWNRNQDLAVEVAELRADEEMLALLFRYLEARHRGWIEHERDEIAGSLFDDPPANARALLLRLEGRLVGVGIVSLTPNLLSSDYFYFEPDLGERSLGTFSMLWEIDWARRDRRRWYHPGFWVADCPAMSYKARLRPAQILDPDRGWIALVR
ncbi:MAG: arginyltransferase [Planctomycetes bacterium]|nr:arginyltransferase [Planctomycetota bacterium]